MDKTHRKDVSVYATDIHPGNRLLPWVYSKPFLQLISSWSISTFHNLSCLCIVHWYLPTPFFDLVLKV